MLLSFIHADLGGTASTSRSLHSNTGTLSHVQGQFQFPSVVLPLEVRKTLGLKDVLHCCWVVLAVFSGACSGST